MPVTPKPACKQILGSWVVLPEPVSPATMMTWCCCIRARIPSASSLTGKPGAGLRFRFADDCCRRAKSAPEAAASASASSPAGMRESLNTSRRITAPLLECFMGPLDTHKRNLDRVPNYLDSWLMPSSNPLIVNGYIFPPTKSWVIITEDEYSHVS